MKIRHLLLTTLMAAQAVAIQAQTTAAHFDMSLTADGKITEAASGQQFTVASQLPAFSVDAIQGQALRFDGYSNYVKAAIPVVILHRSEADRREPILITFTPDASTPKGLQHIPYPVKAGREEITITFDVIIK